MQSSVESPRPTRKAAANKVSEMKGKTSATTKSAEVKRKPRAKRKAAAENKSDGVKGKATAKNSKGSGNPVSHPVEKHIGSFGSLYSCNDLRAKHDSIFDVDSEPNSSTTAVLCQRGQTARI